jgi:U4/U6 small nuclear ribonucleoprotein PRP4
LAQPGHSKGVYAFAFHGDGSLVATGDMGGNALLWDIRTGKVVLMLHGHSKHVLCAAFSPLGFQCATGSVDNTARVWDIRAKRALYTITGHSKLVSQIGFQPNKGDFLYTSSYDKTIKLWSGYNFKLIKTLAGHEARVMRADISGDGLQIASCAFDRTFKLWAADEDEVSDPEDGPVKVEAGAAAQIKVFHFALYIFESPQTSLLTTLLLG